MIAQKRSKDNKPYKVHWTDDGETVLCESATQLRVEGDWTVTEVSAETFYREMKPEACTLCYRGIGYRVAPVELKYEPIAPPIRRPDSPTRQPNPLDEVLFYKRQDRMGRGES